MKNWILSTVTTVVITMGTAAAQADGYTFTPLPFPGGASIKAAAVNNRGQVVGYGYGYDNNGTDRAVLWHRGVPTVFHEPGAASMAVAINRYGQLAGNSFDPYWGQRAVRWDKGIPTTLAIPNRVLASTAAAINARGQVAGNVLDFYSGQWHAVRWGRGNPVPLENLGGSSSVANGMNGAGDVVGYIVSPGGSGKWKPVVWRGKVATVLDVIMETECCNQAAAINDNGDIVGWSSSPGVGNVRAVVWKGSQPTALESLSDADHALAINNRQQAVGLINAGGITRAALWDLDTGEGIDLNTYLTDAQRQEGWELLSADGINDWGMIVGVARRQDTYSAYQLVPAAKP